MNEGSRGPSYMIRLKVSNFITDHQRKAPPPDSARTDMAGVLYRKIRLLP